jgi:hypothetical protein
MQGTCPGWDPEAFNMGGSLGPWATNETPYLDFRGLKPAHRPELGANNSHLYATEMTTEVDSAHQDFDEAVADL